MNQIAIVGAGQLGSRHLQGLAGIVLPSSITVIDPSTAALAMAKQRFEEMPSNDAIVSVRYGTSIDELPIELDYVIVATTADVRLSVLQSLVSRRTVRFMLLEKVLFQRIGEYTVAKELLETHEVRAWVNCPRRIFPLYIDVCNFFGSEPLRYFQAMGGGWGLGCNGIHFLDLLGMLTREIPSAVSAAALDLALISSKRRDFLEFTGSLRGLFGGAQFELTSNAKSAAKLLITIRSESRSCMIDESGGRAFFFDGANWEVKSFSLPLLSKLATSVAMRILVEGNCDLSTYEESMAYHIPLLSALAPHAAAWTIKTADYCPIT